MNISFSIDIDSSEKIKKNIDNQLKILLWLAMNKMRELAIAKVPSNTGKLKSSITLHPNHPGATEYILSAGTDYAVYVEYGSGPHYVPIAPLKKWSRRVLGDENIAYAIRNKIAQEGIEAQPFMRPAYHEVRYSYLPSKAKELLG